MRFEVIRTVADLDRLAPAWNALCDAGNAPMLTRPFWCRPWFAHGGRWRPEVTAVLDGDDLVALAPLQVRKLAGIEIVRFIGHGFGTVSSFVAVPGNARAVAFAWATVLRGGRRFAHLLEYSAPGFSATAVGGCALDVTAADRCLVVDCSSSFDEYLGTRSKKLRENLRRAQRAVDSEGGYVIEVVSSSDRWQDVRREVLEIYNAAEVAQPRQHLFSGVIAGFAEELMTSSAEAGVLRLFVGRLSGRAASFGIAFQAGQALDYWVTRFHPDYAAESVGVLLQRAVIAYGFDHGVRQVDLMLGDGPHKRRWATDHYDTLNVLAASSRPVLALGRRALSGVASLRHRRTALQAF